LPLASSVLVTVARSRPVSDDACSDRDRSTGRCRPLQLTVLFGCHRALSASPRRHAP
jgi:hypothetical protein